MRKAINHDLLWKVIVWVQWHYSTLPHSEQKERLQRPYRSGDGKELGPLITAVRIAYYADKSEHRKQASFETCKTKVISEFQKRNHWDDPTRNFFSSVVATYIVWDRQPIPEVAKPILAILLPYAKYAHGL